MSRCRTGYAARATVWAFVSGYAADVANATSGIDPTGAAKDDLVLAHMLADAAAEIAVQHRGQTNPRWSRKADGTQVTRADWLVEASLRKLLGRLRPDDTVIGEESGGGGRGGRRWYIDPIDGTASYIAGRPDWRTLIAVEDAGTVTTGLVSSPMLSRRWWATRSGGAWTGPTGTEGAARPSRLAVSRTRELAQAKVAIWPAVADLPAPLREAGARLAAATLGPVVESHAAGGVRHGALLVASGLLDAFMFVGAGPWDLAAMVPIVEEAGGRFTDVTGSRSLRTPAAMFSNGVLHDEILSCVHRDRWDVAESWLRHGPGNP